MNLIRTTREKWQLSSNKEERIGIRVPNWSSKRVDLTRSARARQEKEAPEEISLERRSEMISETL